MAAALAAANDKKAIIEAEILSQSGWLRPVAVRTLSPLFFSPVTILYGVRALHPKNGS